MLKQNKKKTTIIFNRVTVLLCLTHLFAYSIVIWEGFLGGGVGNIYLYIFKSYLFIFLMAYIQ